MHSPTSPVTPAEIIEAHLFGELPVRQGALSAEAIRAECPQFRILVIGKANAGKTTVLRKVCNAKPDAKPIIHDAEGNSIVYNAEGKEVQQEIPTKVRLISQSWQKLITKTWGYHDSLGGSRYLRFFDGTRSPTLLMMSSILLLRLSRPNLFIIVSDDLLAWKT